MKGQVKLNTDGPIAKMVLSNPGRRNSLTLSMWEDISRNCEEIKILSNIRVVILTGEGDDFASGADIGDVKNIQISDVNNIVKKAINDLEMLEIPVVCVIRGYALRGGLEIATVCDLRIASESSRFSIPAAKRGIGITRPNTIRLVRLVGIARAKQILLMGETFTAATALQWGLVNEMVSEENLDKRSMEISQLLVKNAPLSLRACKANIKSAWPLLDWVEKDPAEHCDVSEDLQEGMRAFLEKRPPDFKRDLSHEKDGAQATSFHFSPHAFTHLDAPLHMVAKGKSIDIIPVDFFIGDAVLLDIPKGKNEAITAADMERAGKEAKDGDILLIRTGWLEKMWGKEGYDECPYLTADAAEWLVRLKARIAGYDFVEDYSVRDFHRKGRVKPEELVVHQILLKNGILNLEYVNNLSKVSQRRFKVIALPLPLKDCDGSPTRVVAIEE